VVVVVAVAIALVATRSSTSSPRSSSSRTAPAAGAARLRPITIGPSVYTDDFHDPGSGWPTMVAPFGTTFAYGTNVYTITTVAHHSA
jgi:hypothetical protein